MSLSGVQLAQEVIKLWWHRARCKAFRLLLFATQEVLRDLI
jgi:hypothetical protein